MRNIRQYSDSKVQGRFPDVKSRTVTVHIRPYDREQCWVRLAGVVTAMMNGWHHMSEDEVTSYQDSGDGSRVCHVVKLTDGAGGPRTRSRPTRTLGDGQETDTEWKCDVDNRLTDTDMFCSAQSVAKLMSTMIDSTYSGVDVPKDSQLSLRNAHFLPGQRWQMDTRPPSMPRWKPRSPTLTTDPERTRHLSQVIVRLLATVQMRLS